ncbi:MAG: hypothetical protein Q7K55_03390 [Candidatus Levybacteria bacterium]|nr:hypothetical protein [Candidatus Levybacteria bacterium]
MLDQYQRSIEEQQVYLSTQLKRAYPNLEFDEFKWIDNANAHLVIDDLSCRSNNPAVAEAIKSLEISCRGLLQIYPVVDLSRKLWGRISAATQDFNPERMLLIFPGEGAETVKSGIADQFSPNLRSVVLPARRMKDPETGNTIGTDLPWDRQSIEAMLTTQEIDKIVVIDDVIDSGRTLLDLRRKVDYPDANWYAGAPIVFSPLPYKGRDRATSSILEYERIFASIVLQAEENPVPLNSLSSFVEGGAKTDKLVTKCLDQYAAGNEQLFLNSLLQLGKLLGYN